METTLYEYYDHSIMSEVNREFTPNLIKELKSFMVERYVDNMSTKDLVAYVMDDLDRYYNKMDDKQFLDEASDYWEDHFSDVVDELKSMRNVISKRTEGMITLIVYQRVKTLMIMVAKLMHL